MILVINTISANNPKGCTPNDFKISPWEIYEIEFPNPQPGQKPNPRICNGQILKWAIAGSFINDRYNKAPDQTAASKPIILGSKIKGLDAFHRLSEYLIFNVLTFNLWTEEY